MRILLFTGKGGVGKTTVAAATATRAAEHGLRTIVCSTDPAHSLADAFDAPLGDRPTPIAHRLFGQQLKGAGKNIPLFGSDGLFDPDNFTISGSSCAQEVRPAYPAPRSSTAMRKPSRRNRATRARLSGTSSIDARSVISSTMRDAWAVSGASCA